MVVVTIMIVASLTIVLCTRFEICSFQLRNWVIVPPIGPVGKFLFEVDILPDQISLLIVDFSSSELD